MTAPAIPLLHATYISTKAQEVATSLGYDGDVNTISVRFPINGLFIDSPEAWDHSLDRFLTVGDGRITKQFKQSEFDEFVEALAYSYGVDERDQLDAWVKNVKAEAAKLKQGGAEWVEVSVIFPKD